MHSCADGVVVFGWCDDERDRMIEYDWLRENKIDLYVTDIVRAYAGAFVYGLRCSWNESTGQATIKGDKRKLVEAAATKAGIPLTSLKFHLSVFGDYETCHEAYTPGECTNKAADNKVGEEEVEEEDEESTNINKSRKRKVAGKTISAPTTTKKVEKKSSAAATSTKKKTRKN